MIDDWDLIVSSFQTQYGIRLSKELPGMKWREMSMLISGLNEKTPLGAVISIRSESDREVLKDFTPSQRKIRNEWRARKAKQMSVEKVDNELAAMQSAFAQMFAPPKEAEEQERR